MRFLLDTNTVSELLRPQADRGVLSRYQQGWAQCAVPTPVLHEILYGTARMADRQRARVHRRGEHFAGVAVGGRLPAGEAQHAGQRHGPEEQAEQGYQGPAATVAGLELFRGDGIHAWDFLMEGGGVPGLPGRARHYDCGRALSDTRCPPAPCRGTPDTTTPCSPESPAAAPPARPG